MPRFVVQVICIVVFALDILLWYTYIYISVAFKKDLNWVGERERKRKEEEGNSYLRKHLEQPEQL